MKEIMPALLIMVMVIGVVLYGIKAYKYSVHTYCDYDTQIEYLLYGDTIIVRYDNQGKIKKCKGIYNVTTN